jgi:nucleoid DNA-binding protein
VNRTELAVHISKRVGISKKQAEHALLSMTQIIANEVRQGRDVRIVGFGKFCLTHRRPRVSVNPQNKSEKCMVGETRGIRFKPGLPLKKQIRLSEYNL